MFQLIQIVGLSGIYFDAVVVFVTKFSLLFRDFQYIFFFFQISQGGLELGAASNTSHFSVISNTTAVQILETMNYVLCPDLILN